MKKHINNLGVVVNDYIKKAIFYTASGADHFDARDFAAKDVEIKHGIKGRDVIKLLTSLSSAGEFTSKKEVIVNDEIITGLFKWGEGDTCPIVFITNHYE